MSAPTAVLKNTGESGMLLRGAVSTALLRAIGIVFLAEALIRTVLGAGQPWLWVGLGLCGVGLSAGAIWADGVRGTKAAGRYAASLRSRILGGLLANPGRTRARDAVTITREVEDLDDYFITVLPAVAAAAAVPLVVLIRVVFADLASALIIVACLPLVPMFMVLIGRYTESSTAGTRDALGRISDHLAEMARGLPVLIGLGRARDHAAALRKLGEDYHRASMASLRVAFLSSLALELISTISVALVAVVIGLRLVSGSLALDTGLFVLILAPECFLPLRQLGAGYHASENAQAAAEEAEDLISRLRRPREGAPRTDEGSPVEAGPSPVRFVAYAAGPRIEFGFDLPVTPGITSVSGPSGTGKSTVLAALAGLLPVGARSDVEPRRVSYLPQSPQFFAATIGAEMAVYGHSAEQTREACVTADLPVDPETEIAALSPGQQRRLALVRILGEVNSAESEGVMVLLDEPTAHLDEAAAESIIAVIRDLATHRRILIASHDNRLQALADSAITPHKSGADPSLADTEGVAEHGRDPDSPAPDSMVLRDVTSHSVDPAIVPTSRPCPQQRAGTWLTSSAQPPSIVVPASAGESAVTVRVPGSQRIGIGQLWSRSRALLRLQPRSVLLALLCSVASGLAAIGLTAVSAWLIVQASTQPPIMTLMVAIVGVRFFGLGRSVLQYCSRLSLHSAIFVALTGLRSRLWSHFESSGMRDRRMLRSATALRTMVSQADDLRDLLPRVLFPPVTALLVYACVTLLATVLDPDTLPWLLILGVPALLLVPLWMVRAEARHTAEISRHRTDLLSVVTTAREAAADLSVNGASVAVRALLEREEIELARAQRKSAHRFGMAQLLVKLLCLGTALLIAATSTEPTEIVAVITLMLVGLGDTFDAALSAWRKAPDLAEVISDLPDLRGTGSQAADRQGADHPRSGLTEADAGPMEADESAAVDSLTTPVSSLDLQDIVHGWDDVPVLDGVDLHADDRQWTILRGASGSGKSTTLGLLLRFCEPWAGSYTAVTADGRNLDMFALRPEQLAHTIAWCPQEAHVFRSTVRGNLGLAVPGEAEEQQMYEVLRSVGLEEFATADGLDVWVGDHGENLSGGQRQRLAVARTLLTGASVIILDEPTAHLDAVTAEEVMGNLRQRLRGFTVIVVTHDPRLGTAADRVIELAAGRTTSSRTSGPVTAQADPGGSVALRAEHDLVPAGYR